VRRCVGTLTVETKQQPIGDGPAVLQVRAEPEWYRLSVEREGGAIVDLGMVETKHLSTELAGGFVGVFFGMYATGNGTDRQNWASFDWFEYQV
jgi:alpha-N-arabinofuranosidase